MFFFSEISNQSNCEKRTKKQNVILTFMSFSVFVKEKKKRSLWGTPKIYIYINISVCFYLMWVWKVWFIFYFQLLVSEEETQQVAPDFKKSRRQFTYFSTEVKSSHDYNLFNPFISRCKLIISRHQQEVKCLVISGSSSQIILRG